MSKRIASLISRRRGGGAASKAALESSLAHVSDEDRRIVERALPFTMTGEARLLAIVDAVRYCISRGIPGALVECGVWRGGSMLAAILTLQALAMQDREVFLYDTFEGMTAPGPRDMSPLDGSAEEEWSRALQAGRRAWSDVFGEDVFHEGAVRALLQGTGYPPDRLHFVKGAVEQTVPGVAPERIALLRLDTDWYESTRHELVHLFPRLSIGGVLIVDDYGHWAGAKEAVDEYFSSAHPPLLLNRIDYTGRIAVRA
jgi:O-methyltransferase